jgi:predicted short-subunit dehydrogenase-like oxidoreductase (DUF2520 family)
MQPLRDDIRALPPIVLVGPGRVGTAIARAAGAAGIEATLAGRDGLPDALAGAEIALLCVPDGEIAGVARRVGELAPELRFLGHTSGATSLEPLTASDASERFSLHPLQTISSGETELVGAPAAVAGSSDLSLRLASDLASAIGMAPFEVPDESRAAYHAAASIASNYLVALEETAVELLSEAGIDDGRELLAQLVLTTAANWTETGAAALTGPIARGDEATVRSQRQAIEATAPHLIGLYDALAERTRALATPTQGVSA